METMHWRRYAAECFGTGVLTYAVLGSLHQASPTPFIAGLTLMFLVYAIGGISGAHVNPAVTIGLWSIQKIKGMEVALYIAAQLIGAVIAQFLFLKQIGAPIVTAAESFPVVIAEGVGTLLFVFGVSAVASDKVHKAVSGFVVGTSLLLGILVASLGSNGVLNPAVAIGIRSLSFGYILGPIVGAVLGAQLFQWMAKSEA
ncbi:MAG: aquaporin [Candidatus Peregrinibacteria bacterium]